jgi:hypothetical protein
MLGTCGYRRNGHRPDARLLRCDYLPPRGGAATHSAARFL